MVSVLLEAAPQAEALSDRYRRTRALSVALTAPLAIEDQVVQTIAEVSPTKWHLGHTTWFFERFCLADRERDYRAHDERYHYLFNSYYQTVGPMHTRPRRGLLSRPTVAETLEYRRRVDERVVDLIDSHPDDTELHFLVTLGLHHEQQHQELMLTDIKHVFFNNPLYPAYCEAKPSGVSAATAPAFESIEGGRVEIGASGDAFCFDNETPRHELLLRDFAIYSRLVTNAEYAQFIADGGYAEPAHWMADGWSTIESQEWSRPLYWDEGCEREFTLAGWRELDPAAPVAHVSFYEADAFARWAGKRLPSEAEWEVAAVRRPVLGNFLESGHYQPQPLGAGQPCDQYFGDVWEWTASAYAPYPGFKPLAGSLGEYNGKFMCNQLVVRGGSCVTQREHIRASYRSFFYPQDRWQFLGFRLATDA